jgi:hypothetical protein
MRAHDRQTVVKLRTELQQRQSRQRLALTHAQALRRHLGALGETIIIEQRTAFARCQVIAARLERVLVGEGSAA